MEDEFGDELAAIVESNQLCVAGVEDVNRDGRIARDGNGDEDGDGLTDLEEACRLGSDPCLADTDGDGMLDGADADPFDPNVLTSPQESDPARVLGSKRKRR